MSHVICIRVIIEIICGRTTEGRLDVASPFTLRIHSKNGGPSCAEPSTKSDAPDANAVSTLAVLAVLDLNRLLYYEKVNS